MISLDDLRFHFPDLPEPLATAHLRRMPADYFHRHAAASIGRHLRLLAKVDAQAPICVSAQLLAPGVFELLVAGLDRSGVLASITTALLADHFNVQDVQVATWEEVDDSPSLFVDLFRVVNRRDTRSATDLAIQLQARLREAFSKLKPGCPPHSDVQLCDDSSGAAGWSLEHQILGEFQLEEKLAAGGMSEVYRATQFGSRRRVVVKVLRCKEAQQHQDLVNRFSKEAAVLARLNSPRIVRILGTGDVRDAAGEVLPWMALEFLPGGDISGWMKQHGPPPLEMAMRWFRQALEAIQFAHEHHVIHRDIKPHNLLLTADEDLKLTDFGLVRQLDLVDGSQTTPGFAIGTPHYMSPEQAQGENADERSDLFSLGATFYEVFSGQLPFNASSWGALLMQIAREDARPLNTLAIDVPAPLSIIVARMMARSREERYQEVRVVLADLASYERRGLLPKSIDETPLPLDTRSIALLPLE